MADTKIKALNLTTSALFYLKVTAGASTDIIFGGYGKVTAGVTSALSLSLASFTISTNFSFAASYFFYQKSVSNGETVTMRISDIKASTNVYSEKIDNHIFDEIREGVSAENTISKSEVFQQDLDMAQSCTQKIQDNHIISEQSAEHIDNIKRTINNQKNVYQEISRIIDSVKSIITDYNKFVNSSSSTAQSSVSLFATDTQAFMTKYYN